MRLNLSPNPSFEAGLGGWSAAAVPKVVTGGASLVRVRQTGGFGDYVAQVASTAGQAGQGVAHTIPEFVSGGSAYTASVSLGGDLPRSGVNLVLRDSTGKQETAKAAAAGRVSVSLTTAPGASTLTVALVTVAAEAATWWADGLLVEPGGTAGEYFDGSTERGTLLHTWRGAAGASVSAEWSPSISVDLRETPAPTARITISDLPSAVVSRIKVWRGIGGSEARVPGDEDQIPAGAVLLDDYRLPLDRNVTYRVELTAASGVPVATLHSPPIRAAAPDDCSMMWVMDPDRPQGAVLVRAMLGTDEKTVWAGESSVQPVSSGMPYLLSDDRDSVERVVVFRTDSWEQADRITEMIRSGGELLFRFGRQLMRHDTGLLYLGSEKIEETPYRPYQGKIRWRVEGLETRGDMWPLVLVERTWSDVKLEAATWAQVLAARKTWLAVKAG